MSNSKNNVISTKKNTTSAENSKKKMSISNSLVISLIFLQIIMISWFVNALMQWGHFDLEDQPYLYLLLVPILILLVYIPLIPRISKIKAFVIFLEKYLVFFLLGIQIIFDFIFYVYVNRIFGNFPTPLDGGEFAMGWLSSEDITTILSCVWLFISMGILLPSLLTIYFSRKRESSDFKNEWHLGSAIFGLMMAVRWGGSWAMPLIHLIFTALIIPFLVYFLGDYEYNSKGDNKILNIQLFPGNGLSYIFIYWFIFEPANGNNGLSNSWIWIFFCLSNGILFILSLKYKKSMENWEQQENGRRFVFIIACLLILTGVFALLMAINGTISNLQLLWFGLGLFLLGFFPELVNSINNSKKKLKTNLEFRLICWIFCTIIGLAIPFVLNTFDPVSTYLGIIFLGLNALHILPFILSNKNKRN